MKRSPGIRILLGAALLGMLAGCTLPGQTGGAGGPLTATGTVESTEIRIAPEAGGRVLEVTAREGDAVKASQVLVRLDDSVLQSQLRQSQAALKAAQANYDLLKAGPTAEQVRQSQAAVDAAQANYDLLQAGSTDEQVRQARAGLVAASANYSRTVDGARPSTVSAAAAALNAATEAYNKLKAGPQELDYAQAEANYRNAEAAVKKAQTAYDSANQFNPAAIGASPASLALEQATNNINAAKAVYDKAAEQPDAAKLSAASEQVQSARAALDLAANPARSFDMTQAQAQVDQARAALDAVITGARPQQRAAAQAQVAQAQAQLDQLKAGARSQQLDAAKAQVDAAQASVDTLQLQIARMVLVAPADGRLLTRSVEPGEMASAGAPLLTMVRLDDLTLTVYVPEDRYGQVKIGQATQVTVDSFPGVSFNARVATIADKAEFTPRNVQTVEGRSTTVFAIKLTISDASGRLKPGMPADVVFERK